MWSVKTPYNSVALYNMIYLLEKKQMMKGRSLSYALATDCSSNMNEKVVESIISQQGQSLFMQLLLVIHQKGEMLHYFQVGVGGPQNWVH